MKFFTTYQISESIHETPEKYLVCVGVSIARTGEMVYGAGEIELEPGADGKIIISRDQKEVFREETIASFEGKPVTILHPEDFLGPHNWSELSKGILQNVRRGEGEQSEDLVADLLITDSVAIELVKNGLREVSCGYESDFVETGVGRGIQKNIIGNHLALVEKGRAGSSYKINDHNGKGSQMKLSDQIKAIFSKATDEALKAAEVKDESAPAASQPVTGFITMKDMSSYFDSKFAELKGGKSGDASSLPTQSSPAQVEAKDEEAEKKEKEAKDAEEKKAKEEKQAARDAYIDAQMEKAAKDAEEEEGEESEDADEEESEEAEDEVCDEASRVEILAPGMKAEGKNIKLKALLAAYQSADGKEVIEQFTGGKTLDAKNTKFIDAVFIGASEVLKTRRNDELAGTRRPVKTKDSQSGASKGLSPEELNKKNEEHWKNKK